MPAALPDEAVSLRDYFERIIVEKDAQNTAIVQGAEKAVAAALAAQEKATAAAFAASEKQVAKAEANAEKWRENANEWRASMLDREVKFASRTEMESELKAMRTEVQALREAAKLLSGQALGVDATTKLIVAGVGLIATLLSIGGVVVAVVLFLNRAPTPAQPPIYVPAPSGTTLPSTPPQTVPR